MGAVTSGKSARWLSIDLRFNFNAHYDQKALQ